MFLSVLHGRDGSDSPFGLQQQTVTGSGVGFALGDGDGSPGLGSRGVALDSCVGVATGGEGGGVGGGVPPVPLEQPASRMQMMAPHRS